VVEKNVWWAGRAWHISHGEIWGKPPRSNEVSTLEKLYGISFSNRLYGFSDIAHLRFGYVHTRRRAIDFLRKVAENTGHMSKKKILSVVLSILLSILLMWILLSRITIEDLVQTFTRIFYPALFAFIAISLFASVLRAYRYKWLLSPTPISFGNILLVTFIRNLFVDLFPARIGSLSYVYVLNRALKYPFEQAASTFVIAFVFDFLTLSPFLIVAMLLVGIGTASISSLSLLLVAAAFLLGIFLILTQIVPLAQLFLRVYTRLLNVLRLETKTWSKTSKSKIQLTIDALRQIKARKIQWPLFLLSLAIRAAKYGSLYFLLLALLKNHGYTLAKLSFWKTILGITGAEMTGALPIKGIAGFGTWESGWALTFQLLDFEQRIAILSGIGVHLISNIFEYSLGIISILILTMPFFNRKRRLNPNKQIRDTESVEYCVGDIKNNG
jgi:uncharacterized membrane protein YbhN (UPF0104 family)